MELSATFDRSLALNKKKKKKKEKTVDPCVLDGLALSDEEDGWSGRRMARTNR